MKMKFDFEKRNLWKDFQNNNTKLERVLYYIIAGIVVFILLVSAIAGIAKAVNNKKNQLISDPLPTEIESLNKKNGEDMAAFTGISTIRATLLSAPDAAEENNPELLVVTPWFSYPAEDTEFYEELSRKRTLITSIITYYFSSKTKQEILALSEDEIKGGLLTEINGNLSLGKISQLYFTDFVFFE